MIIRNEQMTVFEDKAEEGFVQRLAAHLREDYPDAKVRRSEGESMVYELPDETLYDLVRVSIHRARSHDLTFESSISAFSAIMFEVAPNFDEHNLSSLCLKDKNIEPNDRLDEILKIFNENHWEKVRENYDVDAWEMPVENVETTEGTEMDEKSESEENLDFAETMIDPKSQEIDSKETKHDKSLGFDETFMPEKIGDLKDKKDDQDIDFDATMLNTDLPKE